MGSQPQRRHVPTRSQAAGLHGARSDGDQDLSTRGTTGHLEKKL